VPPELKARLFGLAQQISPGVHKQPSGSKGTRPATAAPQSTEKVKEAFDSLTTALKAITVRELGAFKDVNHPSTADTEVAYQLLVLFSEVDKKISVGCNLKVAPSETWTSFQSWAQ
jgi:hypothetical protein